MNHSHSFFSSGLGARIAFALVLAACAAIAWAL